MWPRDFLPPKIMGSPAEAGATYSCGAETKGILHRSGAGKSNYHVGLSIWNSISYHRYATHGLPEGGFCFGRHPHQKAFSTEIQLNRWWKIKAIKTRESINVKLRETFPNCVAMLEGWQKQPGGNGKSVSLTVWQDKCGNLDLQHHVWMKHMLLFPSDQAKVG